MDIKNIRIAFMGTSTFAVPVLKKLINEGLNIVGIFTQPDKPAGRGQKITFSPVKEEALLHNIEVLQPESKNDIYKLLKEKDIDLAVIASYGMILTKEVTDSYLCLNVHPSILPKYRGSSPIQTALLNGDMETGVTIMVTQEKLDAGEILLQDKIIIGIDDNSVELLEKLAVLGGNLLYRFINNIKAEKIVKSYIVKKYGKIQDEKQATYTKKILKDDGIIDWTKSPREIHNLVRALQPWPSAFTMKDGKRIKIIKTKINENGTLELLNVQPEGKKEMTYKDYLLGNPKIS